MRFLQTLQFAGPFTTRNGAGNGLMHPLKSCVLNLASGGAAGAPKASVKKVDDQ